MLRRRARRALEAEAEVRLLEHLDRLERRLADIEDTVATVLDRNRLDDLDERIYELAMSSTTHDDLLSVRMHAAHLATEVARSVVELRADHAGLREAFTDHLAGRTRAVAG